MPVSTNKISIVNLLYKCSPRLLICAVIVGAIAGGLYSLIIPFVLHGLNQKGSIASFLPDPIELHRAVFFFGMCFLILAAKATSVILVNNIAKSAVAELRIKLAKKINTVMITNVEQFGFPRLLNILADDINNLAAAAIAIPMLLVSTVTVIGMLAYLAMLDLYIFLIVLSAIFLGICIFQIPGAMASRLYVKARALRDVIQEGLRGLVMGAYELKLNRIKSVTYIDEELAKPQRQSVKLEKFGDAMLHTAGTASELLAFFIIGIIVFILPLYMNFPLSQSYGVVMALLYIAGPVGSILGMMRNLKVGQVALQRINELNNLNEDSFLSETTEPLKPWSTFSLRAVTYTYPIDQGSQDGGFSLEPVSLRFFPGQINFIVGGNGSGKSTLSKLLSLHYNPTQGQIYFDDEAVEPANIHEARSRISVIFSNYYLFRKLYRQFTDADLAKIEKYLGSLGLKGKTEFIDGCFTSTRLSDGQRRRLALLVALLENKDIYIFDEWAADQDPEFKSIFYKKILQDMKNENKLVIVITHDDRYFDCADRVIFMEDGRVISERNGGPAQNSSVCKTLDPLFPAI